MGLFGGKWKSGSSSKRHEWIRETSLEKNKDIRIITKLALCDEDEDIRRAAIAKINDENILGTIAISPIEIKPIFKSKDLSDYRIDAVNKISDTTILIDIVKKADHEEVCQAAAQRINDKKALIYLESLFRDKKVFSGIESPLKTWASSAHLELVKKITDEQVLKSIINNPGPIMASRAFNSSIKAAIKNTRDIDILSQIASSHENQQYRLVALDNITDIDALVKIITTATEIDLSAGFLTYADIRDLAIQKITDISVLKKLSSTCSNEEVNSWLLKQIAKLSPSIPADELVSMLRSPSIEKRKQARLSMGLEANALILSCPACDGLFHDNNADLLVQWDILKNKSQLTGGLTIHCPSCKQTASITEYYSSSVDLNLPI